MRKMICCPNCGSRNYKESRQCPQYGGLPVCVVCCRACKYYNQDSNNLYICKFYIKHPQLKGVPTKEQEIEYIEKIRKRLERKEK